MGRKRKEGLLDILIRLPWWMGIGGALLILVVRPVWLAWATHDAGMFAPLMEQVANFFYIVAAVFAVGGLASLVRQWWNGRNLARVNPMHGGDFPEWKPPKPEKSKKAEGASELHWREFEGVIQEGTS